MSTQKIQSYTFWKLDSIENYKHNAELKRADRGTKDMEEFSTRAQAVISHTMHKMEFYQSHHFSWEKHTKLIYHMPWLYK